MDFEQVLASRRAVRSYTSRVVDDTTVERLLRAAVLAPSAMNAQPCVFSIVQSRTQLASLSDRAKRMLRDRARKDAKTSRYAEMLEDPTFNIFYDAGTLIVIGVRERNDWSEADGWLAAENLMLAACDAGLGTCCIGFANGVLNDPEVKAMIGLPPAGAAIAAIIVGHPRSTPPAVLRQAPTIVSWIR